MSCGAVAMAKMYAGSDAALTMGLIMGAHLVSDGYVNVTFVCWQPLPLLLLIQLRHASDLVLVPCQKHSCVHAIPTKALRQPAG